MSKLKLLVMIALLSVVVAPLPIHSAGPKDINDKHKAMILGENA